MGSNYGMRTSRMEGARGGVEVTPDDDNDLAFTARGINLFHTGIAEVRLGFVDGDVCVLSFAPGMNHSVQINRIYATGTTPGITIRALK